VGTRSDSRHMLTVDFRCSTNGGAMAQAASAKNISVRAEWLRQSGRAPSVPSETLGWLITPHPAIITTGHVAYCPRNAVSLVLLTLSVS